jgi:hypothetical protein
VLAELGETRLHLFSDVKGMEEQNYQKVFRTESQRKETCRPTHNKKFQPVLQYIRKERKSWNHERRRKTTECLRRFYKIKKEKENKYKNCGYIYFFSKYLIW